MALSINISLSRKSTQGPNNLTYSINITADLDVSLLTKPKELHQQIAGLYAQAARVLNEQAAGHSTTSPVAPAPALPDAANQKTYRDRMSRNEAALYLGVEPETLATWAVTGRYALPFIRVGKRVLYLRADLDRWLAERTGTSTGEIEANEATRQSNHRPHGRAGRA